MKRYRHIALLLLLAPLLVSCGTDPLTSDTSPDGTTAAMAYTKRMGDGDTYVSIDKKDILKLTGVVAVSLKWVNEKELNVYVPDKSLVEQMHKVPDDITVNIIEEK